MELLSGIRHEDIFVYKHKTEEGKPGGETYYLKVGDEKKVKIRDILSEQISKAMELTTGDLAFVKKKGIVRRRSMEAKPQGQGFGGEVRRLHIVYFLSRKGRIEHPHLIRVHHLSRNGVRLQDVKRWLSDLRGRDMPDSFAWSYKRKYKTGYVWQDLLDEDLITPISDNEYVLKGSEIVSNTLDCDVHSYGEKKVSIPKKPLPEIEAKDHTHTSKEAIQGHSQATIDMSMKTSTEIEEESTLFGSETSTLSTDDLIQLDEKKYSDTTKSKQQSHEQIDKFENSSSFYSNLLTKKSKSKISSNNNTKEMINTPTSSTSSSPWSQSSFNKSKSHSNGASHVLRNLITCRAVDTMDSAMVMISKRDTSSSSVSNNKSNNNTPLICKGERLGGSERIFEASRNQNHHHHCARKSCDGEKSSKKNNKREVSNTRPISAAHKAVNGPNCSQCGKTFNPEKMHAHMKSCKGTKVSAKGASPAAASEKKPPSQSSSMIPLTRNQFLAIGCPSEFQ